MYALRRAKDMADYKAISQNVMHKNVVITDQVYAMLREEEISKRIASLSGTKAQKGMSIRLFKI